MNVVIAHPRGRQTVICAPIQNSLGGIGMTEVPLQRGYTTAITKDCKIVVQDIFTLPIKFFEVKKGFLRLPEQEKVQLALALVFGL